MSYTGGRQCRKSAFGTLPDGRSTDLYTLVNPQGMAVTIATFGATVVSIIVPDKKGVPGDVALGFDSVEGYLDKKNPYIGATIGRYGNRIARGRFTLNGKEYVLATNNGVNHLHGGPGGFDRVLWSVAEEPGAGASSVIMRYTSPNGEEGYPGTMEVRVRFELTDNNELQFHYTATSDADTIVNLTNHAYFNLGTDTTICDHILKLNATSFTPIDTTQIPLGNLQSVAGTPFDFTTPQKIGSRIDTPDSEQIRNGAGYDHNFVIADDASLKLAGSAFCEASGRLLEVISTEPGVQFYSGNFLDGSLKGKNGLRYVKRSGFCLETQHYPDSPNQPSFPTTTLSAGNVYKSTTIYRFSVADSIN